MSKKSNVTPINNHRRPKRLDDDALDKDILRGLDRPQTVANVPEAVMKQFAQGAPQERSAQFEEEANAFYDAHSNDAIAVLEERYNRFQFEVNAAEAEADKVRCEIAEKSTLELTRKKLLIEDSQKPEDQKSWWSRTFGGVLPEDQIKLTLLGGTALIATSLGAGGVFEFLSEYSDTIAEHPLLAVPFLGVPIAGGVSLESFVETIKSEAAKKRAGKIIAATCAVSFAGVVVGLAGMAEDGGGALNLDGGLVPKGLRMGCQIIFEVTAISMITSRFYEIMRPYWPHILTASKEVKTLNETLTDVEDTQVFPRRQYRDRALYWLRAYQAHRKEFVLRACAAFEVVCQTYDAWNKRTG